MNTLQTIQQKLKAPKNQHNKFGGYYYRNCEDILEAVKPLLNETNSTLILDDDVVCVGPMVFVVANATLTDSEGKVWTAQAFARHAEDQKGMMDSQLTGATSSYARKYALNGLFLIDDTKDADTLNNGEAKKTPKAETPKKPEAPKTPPKAKEELTPEHKSWTYVKHRIQSGVTLETIKQTFTLSEANAKLLTA